MEELTESDDSALIRDFYDVLVIFLSTGAEVGAT